MRNMFVVIMMMFSLMIAACGGDSPSTQAVEAEFNDASTAVAAAIAGPTSAAVSSQAFDSREFLLEMRVKDIQREMQEAEPSATVRASTPWNDVLCDQYMLVVGLRNTLEYEDEVWRRSGFAREAGKQKFQLVSANFAGELESLMMLQSGERKKLEQAWEHTCDGMLTPTDIQELAEVYRHTLRDAGIDREIPKALRATLIELGAKPETM